MSKASERYCKWINGWCDFIDDHFYHYKQTVIVALDEDRLSKIEVEPPTDDDYMSQEVLRYRGCTGSPPDWDVVAPSERDHEMRWERVEKIALAVNQFRDWTKYAQKQIEGMNA